MPAKPITPLLLLIWLLPILLFPPHDTLLTYPKLSVCWSGTGSHNRSRQFSLVREAPRAATVYEIPWATTWKPVGYPAGEKGVPTQNIPIPLPQALGLLRQLSVLCCLRQHEDITNYESSPAVMLSLQPLFGPPVVFK